MPAGILSTSIRDRRDFGALANFHDVRVAVEIGVDRGNSALAFLSQWRGHTLYLVDSYRTYGGDGGKGFQWDRKTDYDIAMRRMERHLARIRFLLADSAEAVSMIRDEYKVGFIYIDGEHSYDAVKQDIATWWPRLAPGGILAGHDYHPRFGGVIAAVDEFAAREGLPVYITHEENASWYILKPGPARVGE
jgi:hypothetical protein